MQRLSLLQPIVSAPVFSMQGFQHGVLLERLREREEMRFGTAGGVLVEVEEVSRSASACSQAGSWELAGDEPKSLSSKGSGAPPSELHAVTYPDLAHSCQQTPTMITKVHLCAKRTGSTMVRQILWRVAAAE